jgi:hypothetical protein
MKKRAAWGLGVMLVVEVLSKSTVQAARHHVPPASDRHGASILLVHPKKWLDDEGELWLVDATGEQKQRISTPAAVSGLAVDGARLAYISGPGSGNVYVLSAPGWRPRRVTVGGAFAGTPCWQPGATQLFAGRGDLHADADGGLWLIDTRGSRQRRVLPAIDADAPLNGEVQLSPNGRRVAAGGAITAHFWIRVLDLRSGKQFRQPGSAGILGGMDFAWLDNDNLLVAAMPDEYWEDSNHATTSQGGIRRISLKTGRMSHWLFPPDTEVVQICRSPGGDRFAVALDGVDPTAALGAMGKRILLVDRRTKRQRRLVIAGPSTICGFSPDGRQLLVVTLRDEAGKAKGDAYVIDLRSGVRRMVARDVFEAAWIQVPHPS